MFSLFFSCYTKKYFQFSGRARRKEYWSFILFYYLGTFALLSSITIGHIIGQSFFINLLSPHNSSILYGICIIIVTIFIFLSFIPYLAVNVRRLHDRDMCGWWLLLDFIPFINYLTIIVFLIIYCLKGTDGDNRFGTDPLK